MVSLGAGARAPGRAGVPPSRDRRAGRPRRVGHVDEVRPGAGELALLLEAAGQIELGAHGRIEAQAGLELGAGVGVAVGLHQRHRLVEEGLRRRRISLGEGGRGRRHEGRAGRRREGRAEDHLPRERMPDHGPPVP